MKYFFSIVIFVVFLTSCAPTQEVVALPKATATIVPIISISPTSRVEPRIAPSATSIPTLVSCDPRVADYCITNGHFIFQRPIKPPSNVSVDRTYPYASTANGTREPHHGVEFLNKYGTPVYAVADGVVVFAGPDQAAIYSPWQNFYGNVIVLRHANDLFTLYAHLSKIDVRQGDEVKVGEKIGEVGQSGVAIGSHLHFEVRSGGDGQDYFSTQNPELWLMPNKNNHNILYGAVMISIIDEKSVLQYAELTLTRYPKPDAPEKPYYLDTYVNQMAKGEENAGISDLPMGRYRIAFERNGYLYERWVEVQSGKLTQVVIVVK